MITPEIQAEIMQLYTSNPRRFSPFKVAKKVGATASEVLRVINSLDELNIVVVPGITRRPRLARYVVASREADSRGWDNKNPDIVAARERYCAGTHDLATYREGRWLHLCSFPLMRPRRPRPNYFQPGVF